MEAAFGYAKSLDDFSSCFLKGFFIQILHGKGNGVIKIIIVEFLVDDVGDGGGKVIGRHENTVALGIANSIKRNNLPIHEFFQNMGDVKGFSKESTKGGFILQPIGFACPNPTVGFDEEGVSDLRSELKGFI